MLVSACLRNYPARSRNHLSALSIKHTWHTPLGLVRSPTVHTQPESPAGNPRALRAIGADPLPTIGCSDVAAEPRYRRPGVPQAKGPDLRPWQGSALCACWSVRPVSNRCRVSHQPSVQGPDLREASHPLHIPHRYPPAKCQRRRSDAPPRPCKNQYNDCAPPDPQGPCSE